LQEQYQIQFHLPLQIALQKSREIYQHYQNGTYIFGMNGLDEYRGDVGVFLFGQDKKCDICLLKAKRKGKF